MFKKTIRLLEEPKQKIIDKFTPNYHLLDRVNIHSIQAEYLPRRKINPFRKRPLRVIYDHNDFNNFTLPSRRGTVFAGIFILN
jgi:hypothetical protein